MAEKGLISKSTLTAIADAIRAKTETSGTMLPSEMAAKIAGITTGDVRIGRFKNTTAKSTTFNIGKNVPQGDFALYVMLENHVTTSDDDLIYTIWYKDAGGTTSGKITDGVYYDEAYSYNAAVSISHTDGTVTISSPQNKLICFMTSQYYTWIYAGGGAV